MATAIKNPDRTVVVEAGSVTLNLSAHEAELLLNVVGQFNYGGGMSAIYEALRAAGVCRKSLGWQVQLANTGQYAGVLTLAPRK